MRSVLLSLCAAASLAAGVLIIAPVRGASLTWNGMSVPSLEEAAIGTAEFQKLHGAVAPAAERWTEIPWETDLASARKRAASERKPLFMWIMDGHPLGCV